LICAGPAASALSPDADPTEGLGDAAISAVGLAHA
jgi:hypothetical protein